MCPCSCESKSRPRGGLFGTLLNLLLLYVVLLVGGGTLINTGHPVAVEVGRILHLAAFVDPTIQWAQSHDYQPLASTLTFLADGVPLHHDAL